ncbi:MAG: elongation factor P maturation arginine rhamnosyltransferase EarP [Sulfuricellaceae bacterium]
MLGWRWDIFCTVVDNYGDIGVCWRLARQLAVEHGYRVRLWVDDLASFQRLCPGLDPARERQLAEGVEVRHWAADFPVVEPADVVVEAFACHLPERYVADMAARKSKPLWVNLEYLSAEDWVEDCHGLASPHPRLPLTKYFFFPGFTPATGGLLQERGLEEERRAFLADPAAQEAFWRELGLGPRGDELRVSLFGYGDEDVAGLLTAWAEGEHPVVALVPEGRSAAPLAGFFGVDRTPAGSVFRRGRLEARVLPFIAQEKYDRLLWACDCNFVRGEDSFVRAQWAAKPFVWRIYPQQDDAHWVKLQAFLDRYGTGLETEAAAAQRALWEGWNRGGGVKEAWAGFWSHRAAIEAHAASWGERLQSQGDLVSKLVNFLKNK